MKPIVGHNYKPYKKDKDEIDWKDDKIGFFTKYCKGKHILDVGCVQHDPANYLSKYWLHGALRKVAASCIGLDYSTEGVKYLNDRGYNIIVGNAENFNIGKKFDVITAGDIIEHIGNISKFIESCKSHMNDKSLLLISTPHPWHWRNIIKSLISYDVKPNKEHTCWLCAATLKNFFLRHEMIITHIRGGVRTAKKFPILDTFIPLPTLRNNSIFAVIKKK